ncbi:MAG: PorP/SprF family type IX secretion system membrane protein [Chitinophagales bacterium]
MKKLLIILGFSCCMGLQAQDVAFSQYHFMPLYLNPAMTGFFDGDFRAGVIYRNQWSAVQSNYGKTKYETYGVHLDISMLKKKLKGDYLALGISAIRDQAGDLGLNTTLAQLSLCYSKSFGLRTKHSIALGLQGDFWVRGFQGGTKNYSDGTPESIGKNNVAYDVNVGARYHVAFRKRLNMYIGFAYAHATRPRDNFGYSTDRIKSKYVVSGGAQIDIKDRFNLTPTAMFLMQGGAMQVNVAALAQYIFGDPFNSRNSFSFGLGTRFAKPTPDAIIPQVRLELYGVMLGVACDVNVSGLTSATHGFGAIEVGLQYVFKKRQPLPFTNTRCARW